MSFSVHSLRYGCLALFLALSAGVYAQQDNENQLSVDLEVRSRGEMRRGGMPSEEGITENRAGFITGRTRLAVNYQRKWLEAKVAGIHSGVWGQAGKGSFNLSEAWVKMKSDLGFFAQIGRQNLSYDDERIIGANDWTMATMSHDVLRLGFERGGHKVHFFTAYNQNSDTQLGNSYYIDGAQPYKEIHTLWYHYDVQSLPAGVSLLFMDVGMQGGTKEDPVTYHQQLLGGYLSVHPQSWSFEGAYYRQMGHDEHGILIQSWMASAKASYKPVSTLNLTLGFDYLSGDEYFAVPPSGSIGLVRHEVLKGFNPIYGSHHKFYGAMDFFYVSTYVNGFTPGLQNLYFNAWWKPSDIFSLSAAYHYLAMSANLPNMKKSLGHELELGVMWKPMRDVTLMAGYSYMLGTETMERLKRSSDDNLQWAWLMLTVNPRIFSTRW